MWNRVQRLVCAPTMWPKQISSPPRRFSTLAQQTAAPAASMSDNLRNLAPQLSPGTAAALQQVQKELKITSAFPEKGQPRSSSTAPPRRLSRSYSPFGAPNRRNVETADQFEVVINGNKNNTFAVSLMQGVEGRHRASIVLQHTGISSK